MNFCKHLSLFRLCFQSLRMRIYTKYCNFMMKMQGLQALKLAKYCMYWQAPNLIKKILNILINYPLYLHKIHIHLHLKKLLIFEVGCSDNK